ncbi:MAG: response regulator, partial [Helicobacter sp.]|nr:response regulator [Helicobacter sp.]
MLTKNSEKALKRLKVLYVEDEKDILKLTSMVLEDYVGKLYTANNGKEALEIIKDKNIDVVITDILMPKLNGIELIREIKKSHRGEVST